MKFVYKSKEDEEEAKSEVCYNSLYV